MSDASSTYASAPAPATEMTSIDADEQEGEVEANLLCPSVLSAALSLFPLSWIGACRQMDVNESAVVSVWGKYQGTMKEPGCYCVNPCGLSFQMVSTKRRTTNLEQFKVLDSKGSPLIISGVISWQIVNAKRSVLDVEDFLKFVNEQSQGSLREIASKYPYESVSGPSLKSDGDRIGEELVASVGKKVAVAGIRVTKFDITDLSYAPEIAQAMLVKQQAEATIEARQLIVSGAVDIATSAISQLQTRGVQLSADLQGKVVGNLLTILCGDSNAKPVVDVST